VRFRFGLQQPPQNQNEQYARDGDEEKSLGEVERGRRQRRAGDQTDSGFGDAHPQEGAGRKQQWNSDRDRLPMFIHAPLVKTNNRAKSQPMFLGGAVLASCSEGFRRRIPTPCAPMFDVWLTGGPLAQRFRFYLRGLFLL
jgi:hypothetical protein